MSDTGVTVWDKPLAGKLAYAMGTFNGHNNVAGGSNDSDKLLFTAKIAYSFLDAEPAPAYYVSNTYYGEKDIFTVGAAFYSQGNGIGTAANPCDFKSWNIDALFEKKISGGGVNYVMAGHNARIMA